MKLASLVLGILVTAVASPALSQEQTNIALPAPRMEGGKPLMQVLRDRRSTRAFSGQVLPAQVVSDLLWAAAGISRSDSGKRTAPSARNWQEVEIYAITADGAYLYDAGANVLKGVAAGDLRELTGGQQFVKAAPLNLVYVADVAKMDEVTPEEQALYCGADTGFISENVYLFCASEGLATVVRASVDRPALAAALKLSEQQKIVLAQTVGYPALGTGE